MKNLVNKAHSISNKLRDIETIRSLIEWDLETMSPEDAQESRGRQLITLDYLKKMLLTDKKNVEILEMAIEKDIESNEYDIFSTVIDEMEEITKIPTALEEEVQDAITKSNLAWVKARENEDFNIWEGPLKTLIEKIKFKTMFLREAGQTTYDSILSENEPFFEKKEIDNIFRELKLFLIPLIEDIKSKNIKEKDFNFEIDTDEQFKFCKLLMEKMGFDFKRGRLDTSIHPFTMMCGENDVRITTSLDDEDFFSTIYSTIHEFGHGLYEQNMHLKHAGTLLAECPASSLHESQARLFENQIGKSKEFLIYLLSLLEKEFNEFKRVGVDDFYKFINKISNTTIRQQSDEISYDLHIILRYEMEREIFDENLPVDEIPGRWNEKNREMFGTDCSLIEGCLQDIHWAQGMFGYFPTYTIGNAYASQFLNAYQKFNPNMKSDIENGNLEPFKNWLSVNIHQKGYTKDVGEILEEATGEKFNLEYYKNYLYQKYKDLYNLKEK